ncbi:MAG: glycoside hydrolase family 3 protein [Flavicella sp.]
MTTYSKYRIFILVLSFALLIACNTGKQNTKNEVVLIEKKVDSLLQLMTLEEKIGQMSQVRHFSDISEGDVATKFIGSVIHTDGPTPGNTAAAWQAKFIALQKEALSTRLGIPLLLAVDAVHGQNTFDGATIFPHNIGMGASHNPRLVEEAARVTAIETQATGFNWTFSPCIAIPYNEKWGRVYEAFSESTEMTKKMAIASVKGHQGKLRNNTTVLATAKHFIGDGATDYGKEGGNTTLNDKEIYERLLPPYKAAVQEGIGAVMASFNTLDDTPMHRHKTLLTDSLKQGMNFKGMVITDWKGYSRFGKNKLINAGIDMVMAVDGDLDFFQKGVKNGVENDSIPMARIDDAVRRILRQKFRLGLFENPFPDATLISQIGSEAHRKIAQKAVRESLVLLKNKDKVLPLDSNTKKIVVVGEHANNAGLQSGGWTLRWQGVQHTYKGATTILEGIKQEAKNEVVYDEKATALHQDADVAIVVVGETPYAEMFGDISDENKNYKLTLSDAHQKYVENYTKLGVATIVVLISGRPLVTTKQIEQSDAFVAAWLPGSEGRGIAEVLFGRYDFKGKLPHSWPKSKDNYNGKYGPNLWDKSNKPLFEYGYSLHY